MKQVAIGRIRKTDAVITAYAQSACGPGWSNAPVWVVVQDEQGTIRQECLQPHEQTAEIVALYQVSMAAHQSMSAAVQHKFKCR